MNNNTIDTTYLYNTDTFIINKPILVDSIIKDKIIDSLYTTDSILVPVYIPITTKLYSDTIHKQYSDTIKKESYSAVIKQSDKYVINSIVSGYKPILDSIDFKTVRDIQIIFQPFIQKKNKNFSLGLQIGSTLMYGKIIPYVGVGVQYNLINW